MNQCFDAVRWQGLGEMVRRLDPATQREIAHDLRQMIRAEYRGYMLGALVLNTIVAIIEEGLPDA